MRCATRFRFYTSNFCFCVPAPLRPTAPTQDGQSFGVQRPVLIGEIGIAFDYEGSASTASQRVPAYGPGGDFHQQTLALDVSLRALEENLLSFTLWNYTPDNTNARGDLWNDEDLSVYSNDQRSSLYYPNPNSVHAGGRALPALVRPHLRKVCGVPLRSSFDPFDPSRRFEAVFDSTAFSRHGGGGGGGGDGDGGSSAVAPTVLFLPRFQYPESLALGGSARLGVTVEVRNKIVVGCVCV